MSTTEITWPHAWEPLTPRGIAAFAGAKLRRLLLVQFIVAVLASGAIVWFLATAWFPVISNAIHQLPAAGEIRNEQLDWKGEPSAPLNANHFLGIGVDLNHSGQLGREAHLQFEFGRKNLRVYSMLGYSIVDYAPGYRVAFNRTELEPSWGAWEPWILVCVAVFTIVALLVSWTTLATLYALPVKLITFFQNRDFTWGQSWRLAGAALMPGALFLTFAIVAYSLNVVDLVQLGTFAVLHIVIGWIYLFITPLFLPRNTPSVPEPANPFAPATPLPKATPPAVKDKNPFKADSGV